jgi:hypothetical protein
MAFLAVSFAIVFSEASARKRIHTKSTNEMFRMPFLPKSIHTSSCNSLSTTTTGSSSLLMIVSFAIRFSVIFKEVSSSK